MKRYALSLALLCVSITLVGMKRAEPEQVQGCLFALLPLELLNRIAWYLDFCETDEDFIARVKNQQQVSAEHVKRLEESKGLVYEGLSQKPLAVYSIDQSKIIFLQTGPIQCVGDRVIAPTYVRMFDIHQNKLVSHRFEDSTALDIATSSQGMGLSYDGALFAQVRTVTTSGVGNTERMFYKDELIVRISPMHQKRFTLSENSNHNEYKIGFNKQSTKIAALAIKRVWDSNKKTMVEQEDDQSFLLVSGEEHIVRSVCNLQSYFLFHRICKSIHNP
jgi:hypothetical protein